MRWSAKTIGGKVYELDHLYPFFFDFKVSAADGSWQQTYRINVEFSMHCFTRRLAKDESLEQFDERKFSDSRETRLFDERRHHLSLRLPQLIREIGERKCFHTGHKNFLTVETVDDRGISVDYSIYFNVARSGNRAGLTLYVETAFVQDKRERPRWPRKPIRFSVIAYNVLRNKPIREPSRPK